MKLQFGELSRNPQLAEYSTSNEWTLYRLGEAIEQNISEILLGTKTAEEVFASVYEEYKTEIIIELIFELSVKPNEVDKTLYDSGTTFTNRYEVAFALEDELADKTLRELDLFFRTKEVLIERDYGKAILYRKIRN